MLCESLVWWWLLCESFFNLHSDCVASLESAAYTPRCLLCVRFEFHSYATCAHYRLLLMFARSIPEYSCTSSNVDLKRSRADRMASIWRFPAASQDCPVQPRWFCHPSGARVRAHTRSCGGTNGGEVPRDVGLRSLGMPLLLLRGLSIGSMRPAVTNTCCFAFCTRTA